MLNNAKCTNVMQYKQNILCKNLRVFSGDKNLQFGDKISKTPANPGLLGTKAYT